MKFFITAIVTALLSFALGLYLPWWSLAIAAFTVYALIPIKPGWAFVSGFLSMFILWGGLSWFISSNNDHILAHRISQVIIKKDSPGSLILITALLGGIVGGLAAISGRLFRMLFRS